MTMLQEQQKAMQQQQQMQWSQQQEQQRLTMVMLESHKEEMRQYKEEVRQIHEEAATGVNPAQAPEAYPQDLEKLEATDDVENFLAVIEHFAVQH